MAARQGRQDLHMASGISSTRHAATRICLCELVGLEGLAPAAAAATRLLLCVVGETFRLLFFFFFFFLYLFFFFFPYHLASSRRPCLRLSLPPQSSSIRTPFCGRPSHPLFFILRFQQNAPTHGPGLAWRLRMTLPHLLSSSHVSCLLSWLTDSPNAVRRPGKYRCLGQTSWSRLR